MDKRARICAKSINTLIDFRAKKINPEVNACRCSLIFARQ